MRRRQGAIRGEAGENREGEAGEGARYASEAAMKKDWVYLSLGGKPVTRRDEERTALRVCFRIILVHLAVGGLAAVMLLLLSLFQSGLRAEALRLFSLVPLVLSSGAGIVRAVWIFVTW
jgi:hypothetical protein